MRCKGEGREVIGWVVQGKYIKGRSGDLIVRTPWGVGANTEHFNTVFTLSA